MTTTMHRRLPYFQAALAALALLVAAPAFGGAQVEEQLAPSVVTVMSRALSDSPAPAQYAQGSVVRSWIDAMAPRLATRFPDVRERSDFLATVHYEAMRAGLDPQLMLGVIQHESGFHKYAVSPVGARGFMQVMPFWMRLIGNGEQSLFHLRTNLRYGAVILRHYLDMENGDVFRALGRYNGSLGRPDYPQAVFANMARNWQYTPAPTAHVSTAPLGALAAQSTLR